MNQTLEIQLQAPLDWESLPGPGAPTDNRAAFQLLEGFSESQAPRGEEETEAGELQRIEQKLDLVVQLLLPLLRDAQPLPPSHTIHLAADHITWRGELALHENQFLKLTLYPEPRLPCPLTLYATVTRREGPWVEARFEQLSESDSEALERWIFRQHRRQVARQRHRS